MVPTDTHSHSGDVGHHSVALKWSSVVDGRPDRPPRGRRRIVPDVCGECSSKSIHCSKVHGSYHLRTIGLGSFTRRPVWTRRASHLAPSGRPPRGGAKVTWFRYPCEYRRYSREDASCLMRTTAVSFRSLISGSAAVPCKPRQADGRRPNHRFEAAGAAVGTAPPAPPCSARTRSHGPRVAHQSIALRWL